MRPFSPPSVRRALAALCATAAAVVLAAAPASADRIVVPDPGNSAVVTRLSITNGKGWLTVHVRSVSARSFTVVVPGGKGSWGGKSDVYLPEQDAHCTLVAGRALYYICHRPGWQELPSGGFAVSIPVTRTGSVEGLTGWASADDDPYGGYTDTFPVLDGSHYRSTAEVRNAPITREAGSAQGRTTLSVTTTIVPGESITALDVTAPMVHGNWWIIGSNTANHGVRCITTRNLAGALLHCTPSAPSATSLPAGRYHLVFDLAFYGPETVPYSQVSLTSSGHSPEVEDTFAWATASQPSDCCYRTAASSDRN